MVWDAKGYQDISPVMCSLPVEQELLIPSPGFLQPLHIPTQVWTNTSLDFIEGLPTSHGYTVILVIVDKLTKYGHFISLSYRYIASTVAHLFLANVLNFMACLRLLCQIGTLFLQAHSGESYFTLRVLL